VPRSFITSNGFKYWYRPSTNVSTADSDLPTPEERYSPSPKAVSRLSPLPLIMNADGIPLAAWRTAFNTRIRHPSTCMIWGISKCASSRATTTRLVSALLNKISSRRRRRVPGSVIFCTSDSIRLTRSPPSTDNTYASQSDGDNEGTDGRDITASSTAARAATSWRNATVTSVSVLKRVMGLDMSLRGSQRLVHIKLPRVRSVLFWSQGHCK
jgi:hypothetical protein